MTPQPRHPPGRRLFLAGAAASPFATARAATVLSGPETPLRIEPVPMNVTGRPRMGVGINGGVPAPILRWREGETVSVPVTNRLDVPTSLHWHGLRVPLAMDGVPGFGFRPIAPGETFTYRFPLRQAGTYWYHSHSGFQEQSGLYGAIVVDPAAGYRQTFARDYVVLLSDWTDETPEAVLANLKTRGDYYNRDPRTAAAFIADARRMGLSAAIADRAAWGAMRMSPHDLLDVTAATYTYLMNGHPPGAGWTALFRPGERIRLRLINASAMTIFDLRLPGLPMTVVQADGNDIQPVAIDEIRLGPGETYDVLVRPGADRAYAIFAQALDRGGYALGCLAPRAGMTPDIPPMDPRPRRTMADMGMNHGGMAMDHGAPPPGAPALGVSVDNVAAMPMDRTAEPGTGLENNGRRVLTYSQLRAIRPGADRRPPSRDIVLHLTGNMDRYIWGFDGKAFSASEPIPLQRDERVRFVLINDTMMEHPIHLHGLWSEVENGAAAERPFKHTILVKPAERLSFLVTADEPGRWAFHCHFMFHMDLGMFREVRVS